MLFISLSGESVPENGIGERIFLRASESGTVDILLDVTTGAVLMKKKQVNPFVP